MTQPQPDTLALSSKVLRALITLNWLFGGAILVFFVWTLLAGDWVATALGNHHVPHFLAGMRMIMLIGIAATPVAYVVFSRLLSIVATVRDGDPFVARNAQRLQTIAWAVLALELSRYVVVAIAHAVSTPMHPVGIELNFSVTPWLAVLLLFVLARVFDQGARMREELKATV